jgi:hypothetical protein
VNLFVPVAGTDGAIAEDAHRLWWYGFHPWQAYMREQGFAALDPDDPFYWSTDLSRRAWIAGGLALIWYLTAKMERLQGQPLRIVCHSFGINVVAYAAYYGLEIDTLIAITPPYRATMDPQYRALAFRTRRWLTVHAHEFDRMVVGGGIGDGELTSYPPMFEADLRDVVEGIGHSKVLYDPAHFHHWKDQGWLELLTAADWGSFRSLEPRRLESSTLLPRPIFSRRSADRFNLRLTRSRATSTRPLSPLPIGEADGIPPS